MASVAQRYPKSTAEIARALRNRHINPTQQRMEIARVLLTRPQHLSAEQVLVKVNRDESLVSKATVYNTLGLFAQTGLVKEVIVDPSRVFYDSNTQPHYHLYHTDSGKLSDIEAGDIAVQGLPNLPDRLEIEGIDVIIRVSRTKP